MALTNAQLWNYLRGKFPNFASHTAEATAEFFTERGFENLSSYDPDILNDFFNLSLRVFLQKINVADVKDLLESQDFGESYNTPYGGVVQRMAINSIKPVSPAYMGLKDGDSPDPFVVRKPDTSERFWYQNFSYQSLVTMPDTAIYKNMFVAEDGMSQYLGGVMKALQNGYTLQKYNNKLEAINAIINPTNFTRQDTQDYQTSISPSPSSSELIAFIKLVRDIVDSMVFTPATSAFNCFGFESTQDKSRLRILVRPSLMNELATISKLNSPEDMSLPIEIVKVPNFGGLTVDKFASGATVTGKGTTSQVSATDTPSYTEYKSITGKATTRTLTAKSGAPVAIYDDLGTLVAYGFQCTDADGYFNIYCTPDAVVWDDPNEDVIALIADKGIVFENVQNPYTTEPVRNARGLYTNYWCSSPNNGCVVDHIYNSVTITNSYSPS